MGDLWDSPNYQANEGINDGINGCQCALCLGYDVMKETILNEKSCIQVLKILISKADTDIIELEEELINLLSQLASTDKVFSDMFSMYLRMKIEFLDLSIRKLKDGPGDFSPTRREPAESIDDILKALFSRYIQKKDGQFAGNISNVASSDFQVDADNPFGLKKQMERSITAMEKHTFSPTRVKIEEENANHPASTKYTSPISKYSAQGLFQSSTEMMKREVNKFQEKSPIITKGILQSMTPIDNSNRQNPSLETRLQGRNKLKMIKSQTDDERIDCTPNPLEKSSEEPNAKPKIIRELVFSLDNSNSISLEAKKKTENTKIVVKQEPGSVSHCLRVPSTKIYKRRQKLNPLIQTSSTSPCPVESETCCSNLDMGFYTVDDLKAIARQQKVRGFSKLRKLELAQVLGIKITEGKKQQKRKETPPVSAIKGEPQI